jgi:sirohydrochlorin ferrochelatase
MDPQGNSPHPTPSSHQTAVLLIAHGSREPSANADLHELAARLAAAEEYPIVEACFLELAEPDIPTGGDRCVARGATRVLMIPYFLSAGVHLRRDLTAAREELSRRHPGVEFPLGSPLGPHPLLDSLVAARILELEGMVSGSRNDPWPATVASDSPPPTTIDTNPAKH